MRVALACALVLACASSAAAQIIQPGFSEDAAHGVIYPPSGSKPVFQFNAPAAGDYAALPVSTGQTPTITRASTKTAQTSATALVSVASGHFAVDYRGLSVEASATNGALWTMDASNAAYTKSSITIATDQCVFPDGTTTMDKATSTAAGGVFYQFSSGLPSGTVFTSSAWVATVSGTGTGSVVARPAAGTVTNCTCSMPAGCSASIFSSNTCLNQSTVSTTPTRIGAQMVSDTAAAGAYVMLQPGAWNNDNGGVACFGGMQIEAGAFPTSYIPTTTTAGGATSSWQMWLSASGTVACRYDATTDTSTATVTPGVATKLVCKYDGARLTTCVAGVCDAGTSASLTPVTSFSHFYLGNFNGTGFFLDGFVSQLCADKKSGGCS